MQKDNVLVNKAYILGGVQSDFERNWTKEGKNVIALLSEVIGDAFRDVNIGESLISDLKQGNRVACFVGNFIAECYINQGHLGALLTEVSPLFYGIPSARYEAACASSSVAIDAAKTKIEAGEIDLAIVVGWELMKTVDPKKCGDILGRASYYVKEGQNIDFPFPKLFGQLADETMKKYNLEEEDYLKALAKISTINYNNAKRNPLSQTRKWFMNYDHAINRGSESNSYIGGHLAISDCSQVTDGAVVVFLASEKLIEDLNRKDCPFIKGYGHRVAPMLFEKKMKEQPENKFILPWTRQAVLDAYNRSGLTVDDIDVFETHDCFTSSEFVAISSFGICDPGNEIEVINQGIIDFDGVKPINPSGGLIGCGHPVGASGCRMLLDLYKQVSGNAESYQIIRNGNYPRNGMMLNIGGSATTNYVYIIGK